MAVTGRTWRSGAAGLVSVLVAATLTACGAGSHPGSAPATTAPPATGTVSGAGAPVHWTSCQGSAGPPGFQCATVMVPRDPTHPGGPLIAMAIDRHRATGSKIGSLLVNPGGPGVSGVDALPGLVAEMPRSLTSRFDVVGFDPPGVGRTAPIRCLPAPAFGQYLHVDPDSFSATLTADRTLAAGCEQMSGAELPYVSTVDAARDMDVLRQALGDQKLTYLGFSYGTKLGATYAGLYPTHVRAMVLDGALDPATPVLSFLNEQSASLQSQFDQFATWCAANGPTCRWQPGSDATTTMEALVSSVRANELPAHGTSRTVGPSELLYGTAWGLYTPTFWPALGQALASASQGDGTGILALFDQYTGRQSNGTYSNLFESNAAINALDAPAPTLAQIQAAVPTATAASPIFGVQNLYSELSGDVWPVPATGRVGPIRAAGSPPIVVVGSTGDPVTPYAWAQALASELASGVLLTRIGDGHTAYGASSCVRDRVTSYLVDLTVPPAGLRCPSD